MVEEKADQIISEARDSDVAFLVVGDPFGATTHTDLVVRAKKLGIQVKGIHNALVMNAIGICSLQLYRYGDAVSIPFFTETWRPDSFYEKIKRNRLLGLHTLCLLDIRVKEPTLESLCRGKKKYEPPRYMTVNIAIEQLLEVEQLRGESVYDDNTLCVGFARLGSEDQMIVAGTMRRLQMVDFGAPLHCLVIVGETHPEPQNTADQLRFFHELDDSLNNQIRGTEAVVSELWNVEEYDLLALALDGRMKVRKFPLRCSSSPRYQPSLKLKFHHSSNPLWVTILRNVMSFLEQH